MSVRSSVRDCRYMQNVIFLCAVAVSRVWEACQFSDEPHLDDARHTVFNARFVGLHWRLRLNVLSAGLKGCWASCTLITEHRTMIGLDDVRTPDDVYGGVGTIPASAGRYHHHLLTHALNAGRLPALVAQ
jgi:hypothetical protein